MVVDVGKSDPQDFFSRLIRLFLFSRGNPSRFLHQICLGSSNREAQPIPTRSGLGLQF